MFVFGSIGRGHERLSYLGIGPCPNCDGPQHLALYRAVRKASLYFIPVYKQGQGHFLACDNCEAGKRVSDAEADAYLAASRTLPRQSVYYEIYGALTEGWTDATETVPADPDTNQVDFDTLMREAREHAYRTHPEEAVDRVSSWPFAVTLLWTLGYLEEAWPRITWSNILAP